MPEAFSHKLLISLSLLLSSLCVYLEWGGGNAMFIYEMEWQILSSKLRDLSSLIHPFVLLPLIGQLVLLMNIFTKRKDCILIYIGWACISLLMIMIMLAAVLSFNIKSLVSVIPFIICSVWALKKCKQKK